MTQHPDVDLQSMLQREFRWVQRMTRGLAGGDAAAADDLTQDTLLSALTQPRGAIRRPRSWLRAVARNLWVQRRRQQERRREVETAAAQPASSETARPDEVVARTQLLGLVVAELLALSEPYRTALLLRFQEGLALGDAARRLGVPTETARTRQKRGLAQLRERLDRRHGSRAGWVALLGPAFAGPAPVATAALPLFAMAPKLVVSLVAATIAVGVAAVLWQAFDQAPEPVHSGTEVAADPSKATGSGPATASETPTTREVAGAIPGPTANPATLVVTGRIVDEETGAAIRDAAITWRRGTFADRDASGESATSASDGTFTLRSTASDAERQELVIRSPDHALFVQRLGVPTPAASQSGPTQPGPPGVDEPPNLDVGTIELPPGTGVHGEVVDATGAPVAGAELLLCSDPIWTTHGQRRMQLQRAFPQGRTDRAGRFALPDRVYDRGPSHRPLLIAHTDGGLGWRQLAVRRSRHESRDNRVTLLPSARLLVRVVDQRGEPVRDARVVAEPRFPPIGQRTDFPFPLGPLESLFTRLSDFGGRVAFDLPLPPDVEGSAYALRVTAAQSVDLLERDVELSMERPTELTLMLTTERAVTVSGHIVDGDGEPIAAALVAFDGVEPQSVQTGNGGEYEATVAIDGVAVAVRAEASGHTTVATRLPLEPGQDHLRCDLQLEAALPLHGIVVDQQGEPVAEATVHVASVLRGHVRTDAEGRFEVPGVPAARAAAIGVYPPNGSNAFVGPVQHAARPGASPLRLTLDRLASGRCRLEAELVGARGERLEIERLQLVHLDRQDRLGHPATPTLGAITATGLRPGSWRLDVRAAAGPGIVEDFVIRPGQELCQLRLVQSRGVGLDVAFVLPDGAALPAGIAVPEEVALRFAGSGQTARLALPDGTTVRRAKVDPRRHPAVQIVDVDPTRALVLIAEADGWIARRRIAKGAVDGGEVRLQLAPAAAVVFESATPWPFDGFVLQFRHADGAWGERMRFSGMQGRTELVRWPLPAGGIEWRLTEPTVGADNRGEPRVHRGSVELAAGEPAPIVIRPGR